MLSSYNKYMNLQHSQATENISESCWNVMSDGHAFFLQYINDFKTSFAILLKYNQLYALTSSSAI